MAAYNQGESDGSATDRRGGRPIQGQSGGLPGHGAMRAEVIDLYAGEYVCGKD